MSWYTNYYLCIIDENGKFKPYGAKIGDSPLCLMSRSRSFEYGIADMMREFKKDKLSDEFLRYFEMDNEDDGYYGVLSAMRVSELPKGRITESGYVPAEELNEYLSNKEHNINGELWLGSYDGFSEVIQPDVFSLMLSNPMVDKEKLSEYVFYSWVAHGTKEFQAYELRQIINTICDEMYGEEDYRDQPEVFILCQQG